MDRPRGKDQKRIELEFPCDSYSFAQSLTLARRSDPGTTPSKSRTPRDIKFTRPRHTRAHDGSDATRVLYQRTSFTFNRTIYEMGKGNAQKTAAARARNNAAAESEGKGGGGAAGMASRAGNLAIVCTVCRTGFMAAQSRSQLQAHVDSKHSKTHTYDQWSVCGWRDGMGMISARTALTSHSPPPRHVSRLQLPRLRGQEMRLARVRL